MVMRVPESSMSRSRAADDFETIRTRIEELRRKRLPERGAAAKTGAALAGHRGPCACGLSLFADDCDGSCKALRRAPAPIDPNGLVCLGLFARILRGDTQTASVPKDHDTNE